MSTEEEAQRAIDELNGKELDARALNVSEAREETPRENRSFGDRDNRGGYDRR